AAAGVPLLALSGLPRRVPSAAGTEVPLPLSGRVLLLEDEDVLADVVTASLRERGLAVERVRTQDDAVAALQRTPTDLAVLGLLLGGGDGSGVVDALQRTSPDCLVLVHTVHDLDEPARQRLQTGRTSFLQKGRAGVDDLVDDVVRLLSDRRRGQGDSWHACSSSTTTT
ncbi:MAG: multi-component transcriptional regulator, winged helix family, partial [Frankiales bacterium]|nr:multi-component transcriptional regulator, winged helix family [Frankiales bacterium]